MEREEQRDYFTREEEERGGGGGRRRTGEADETEIPRLWGRKCLGRGRETK